jgi:hypothetical protein
MIAHAVQRIRDIRNLDARGLHQVRPGIAVDPERVYSGAQREIIRKRQQGD